MSVLTNALLFGDTRRMSKQQMFIRILILLGVLSALAIFLTRVTLFAEDNSDFMRIAVVGPMTGKNEVVGRSLKQGAELYFDQLNQAGGIDGVKFAIEAVDDKDNVDAARQAAAKLGRDARIQAAIGHWSKDVLGKVSPLYKNNGLVLVTPSSTDGDVVASNEWFFSTLFSSNREAAFIANYSRNVLGNKLTSIIFDEAGIGPTLAENYEKTYRRFGTAVRQKWSFDHTAENVDQRLDEIVAQLKKRKDAGAVFIATRESEAAKLVKKISDARIRNLLIGPNNMATDAFRNAIKAQLKPTEEVAKVTNRILVSTPLLFDTANETAQNFRDSYIQKYGTAPDWIAAYAFDSANLVAEGMRSALKGENEESRNLREGVKNFLASRRSIDQTVNGITGSTFFNEKGQAQKPVLVGIYDGENIISALTQLNPIKPGTGGNLIQELKRGRVLYVNDRFMYKTNVVYTGISVNEVSELDVAKNQYDLDFDIWFRYRGKFEPQDMKFANAVEPIKLEKPIEDRKVGGLTYRLYRVKGKFNFNFTDTLRKFNNHVVGVRLSHNTLNRNNLLYVVDVLGIGLDSGTTMLEKVQKGRAVNANLGWLVDRAWISPDISVQGTRGNPAYVGFGSAEPDFSQIDLGILLKPAEFNARDFVPGEWFIYLGIIGLLGIIFAVAMDRKEKGRFWAVQSWGLRVVAWPMFLLAAGNLSLDLAFQNLSIHMTESVVLGYDILWWMIPARLTAIAAERFVWQPLEDHTERTIPNVIRVFGSVVIYSFALFAVIAFVLGQQLTSLLASTGLLAMIIGLAVQANISNIFSGIVINLERPFHVGDWITIGEIDEGKVVDITWRTTRIRTRNGYVISVPNGQVSEAQIHNYDSFDSVRVEMDVYLDASLPMEEVSRALDDGLANAENILKAPAPEARFLGVEWNYGWIARYELQFWISSYDKKPDIQEGVMETVFTELNKHGMAPGIGKKSAPGKLPFDDSEILQAGE